ncbi:MAG: hypothetical protein ACR2FH_03465 [Caulobacteraceae bacterium]
MRSWFGGRATPVVRVDPGDGLEAYKEGRADERARVDHDVGAPRIDRGAINDAYDRGRREERLRHRGSPLLALITAVLVIIALAVLILAVNRGSFMAAGAVIDGWIRSPVQTAADKTGNALQNAGQDIKDRAGSTKP